MVAIQAVSTGSMSISIPFLPLFIQQLGVHPISVVESWSGVVQSTSYAFSVLTAPVWGALADRQGRKPMVMRASFGGALAALLMGLSPNIGALVASRVFLGLVAGFGSAATALISATVPSASLGFALGWMATAQMAGTLIGPLIGGAIADLGHNYRLVYYCTAAGGLAVGLLTLFCVRERFERKSGGRHERGSNRRQMLEIVRHPEVAPLLVVLMVAQVTALSVQPIVPLFVQHLVGPAPYLATLAGAAFAVIGVGDMIASPFLGKRSDTLGYRRVLLICLCGAGLFTVPQGFTDNVWVFLALRFGVGLFLGGILPTANAWIGRLFAPERRGSVYGLSYSAVFLGMFLGPMGGGFVAAHFGFTAVFLVTGALILANALWVTLALRSVDPQREWQ
jgi:DHA1 family multidrug resistance protein-like MFS transporter